MRTLTLKELAALAALTSRNIEACLLEPTKTGLEKSILDATHPVRAYLKNKGIHNFDQQLQGPDHKVMQRAFLLGHSLKQEATASLYRPQTKLGDPRIWFKGLGGGYCQPNDIIAIVAHQNDLYLINLTRSDVPTLVQSPNSPIGDLAFEMNNFANSVADELLAKLRHIASRGPVPSEVNADTGIGRTLETLLGINQNSSKQPDYQGIEIKASRGKRQNRKNLFAQVPNWSISAFKSSAEVLNHFGYRRGMDFKLYCTVTTRKPNSQGLQLRVATDLQQLLEHSQDIEIGDFLIWELDTLHRRLLEKHNETFWVTADSVYIEGIEHFLFKTVEHTRKPLSAQFDILLEQGQITLDHLIKRKTDGRVVEKGPLFKINPKYVNLLFPPSQTYDLIGIS